MLCKDGRVVTTNGRPRIDVEKQKEIKRLFAEGRTGYYIAKTLKMSLSTVYRYRDYEPPSEPVELVEPVELSKGPEQNEKPLEGNSGAYTMPKIEEVHIFTKAKREKQMEEVEVGKRPKGFGRG